jgi:hypothetical protein
MSTQDKSQIRRYLSNQMNVEEKFNFELEMLNNPKLKKEVVLMEAALRAIEQVEEQETHKHSPARNRKLLVLLLSLIAVLGSVFILIKNNTDWLSSESSNSHNQYQYEKYDCQCLLIASDSRLSEDTGSEAMSIEGLDSLFQKAIQAYYEDNKTHKQLLDAFNEVETQCAAAIEDDEENCCACQTSYWKARIHEKFGYTSEAIKYYEATLGFEREMPKANCDKRIEDAKNKIRNLKKE